MKKYLFILSQIIFISSVQALIINGWLQPKNIPFPQDNPPTKEKIELGKLLFFDTRLSANDDISCASCHDPKKGWSDGLPKAVGDQNKVGRRNSPTLLNTAYLEKYFHDGRADSLEEQALGPIEAEVEMNMPIEKLVKKLNNIAGYKKLFAKAFGQEEITKENIVKAIASFERTIVSADTRFYRYITGDEQALSQVEQIGFDIFLNEGRCNSCHNGFNFTNESFNNVGLNDTKDLGVYELNKQKLWYGTFKTPTLLDIEKTAPYFHDGSVATLKEAVSLCGNGGRRPVTIRSPFFRDRGLSEEEVDFVVAFLKTLSTKELNTTIPTSFPK